MRRGFVGGLVVVACLAAGCSDDDGGSSGESPTTTAPLVHAVRTGEETLNPGYRQGLARLPDGGWIFSGTTVLARTDDALVQQVADTTVPDPFAGEGFNHVGDVDVEDGVLYVPLEQPNYDRGEQIMGCYDPETLAYERSDRVAQRHNSFVAVEGDRAYSMRGFSGDAILVYEVGEDCSFEPLDPIPLSATVRRVQGGDVADGALWLATDDAERGLYRVDLELGTVQPIGSLGHVRDEGEGEGIDATDLPTGQLHAVNIVDSLDVRLAHFELEELSDPRDVAG
jgi:hypothetical protein